VLPWPELMGVSTDPPGETFHDQLAEGEVDLASRREIGEALQRIEQALHQQIGEVRQDIEGLRQALDGHNTAWRKENSELRTRVARVHDRFAEVRSDIHGLHTLLEAAGRNPATAAAEAATSPDEPPTAAPEAGENEDEDVEEGDVEEQEQPVASLPIPTAREDTDSATAAPTPAEHEQPADVPGLDREGEREHYGLLLRAASISSAALICHRDVWAFLAQRAGASQHFHLPDQVEDAGNGKIRVSLSGPSLIAALTATRNVPPSRHGDDSLGEWALAATLYRRMRSAINTSDRGVPRDGVLSSDRIVIVLDDHADTSATPTAHTQPKAPNEAEQTAAAPEPPTNA
jgi:hypothetical protein